MSLDLFRPATSPPRPSRSTRFFVMPLSVAAHMAVLVALVVIPLTAADVLPIPRELLVIMQAVAPPPVPPAPVPPVSRAHARVPEAPKAPVEAPTGIADETKLPPQPDLYPPDQVSQTGVVPGTVDSGLPGVLDPPPDRPRRSAAPIPVGGDVTAPRKVHDVRPEYPALALKAHVEGTVIIQAIIGPTGAVADATVLRSVPLLDEAALAAVRQWQYTPPRLNGIPISVIMTVTVTFTIKGPVT